MEEQQDAAKVAMDEIKEDNKQKSIFMQVALSQYKAERSRAEEEHRSHLEKRMKAILTLKDNIADSEVRQKLPSNLRIHTHLQSRTLCKPNNC